MKKRLYFITFLVVFVSFSCTKSQLMGKWQGEKVIIAGKETTENIENISLHFDPNGAYEYQATDGYVERGTYKLNGKNILTTDTLNKKSEKMVAIDKINNEYLTLKMKSIKGEDEFLTLKKIAK